MSSGDVIVQCMEDLLRSGQMGGREGMEECWTIITLCAKLSGTVYCYRSCLWRVGGMCLCVGVNVCGSVTMITRNRMH